MGGARTSSRSDCGLQNSVKTARSSRARCPGHMRRIGIQHPENRHQIVAVVEGEDLAIATSGIYAHDGTLRDGCSRAGVDGRLRGYEALTLLADGRSLRTPGFAA